MGPVMGEVRTYENFPAPIVAVSVLVTISIYALGALILTVVGPVIAAAYLLYCVYFEVRVMKHRCVNCCYYWEGVHSGQGKDQRLTLPPGRPAEIRLHELQLDSVDP
jgi:hypothetical protein